MSKYKIKEDANQPRLLGYLKSRNTSTDNSELGTTLSDPDPDNSLETSTVNKPTELKSCNALVTQICDRSQKRKHPSSSPDCKTSPPSKSSKNSPIKPVDKVKMTDTEIDNMEKKAT